MFCFKSRHCLDVTDTNKKMCILQRWIIEMQLHLLSTWMVQRSQTVSTVVHSCNDVRSTYITMFLDFVICLTTIMYLRATRDYGMIYLCYCYECHVWVYNIKQDCFIVLSVVSCSTIGHISILRWDLLPVTHTCTKVRSHTCNTYMY